LPNVAFYSHPDYDLHVQGPRHPERPERTKVLKERLRASSVWNALQHIEPEPATVEQLQLIHEPDYIASVERFCEDGGGLIDGRETGAGKYSYRIARLAAGAVTGAVDRVLTGASDAAFCAVRPPGHHALTDRAMGFCLFNNAAIGARHAQRHHGIERVLIVDWDFHHGNGTQDMFYADGSVMYFSVHCSPAYPYTGYRMQSGEGPGLGCIVNAPLSPGAGAKEYLDAFHKLLIPAARRFRPDLVIISAGFDAHREDPLSLMRIDTGDFDAFTEVVRGIADEHCGGRIVSVLEGGYNVDTLAASVEVHLQRLLV
jgi:acetoin utilization deacetylase AcuC-like enzyme